ncbi:hypothetical protein [Tenacibaculum piscium]|uniref:hypothetical protein n=1 Tax=Tenacibaculum piscium TaxID=1458515 RepID=UPI001F2CF3C9|nr:hypothetical protein [Tenacibaculum piscium]
MDTKKISSTLVSAIGNTAGIGIKNVVADVVPIENGKIKHGVLLATGVLGAVFLNRKNKTTAFAQDVSIGVAGSSLISLAKEFITEPKGVLKTALGNPESEINFLSGYDDYDLIDDNEDYSEDAIYQSVTPEIIFG